MDDPPRVIERSESFMPDLIHHAREGTDWGVVDLEDDRADVEATLRKLSAKHFRLRKLHLLSCFTSDSSLMPMIQLK
jgi:hypothetical protein